MKHISSLIKSRYASVLPILIFHGLLVLFMISLYRILVYRQIIELYPDLKLNGFLEYTSLSLHYDSIVILFAIIAVSLFALLLTGYRKTMYVALGAYSIIFIFFILFSIDFFKVYQTTFQTNFAGREHFSGLGNVFDSARAEFSDEFYALFFPLSALSAAAHVIRCRHEAGASREREIKADRNRSRLAALTVPALVALFIVICLGTDASVPHNQFDTRYRKDQVARNISLLHDFSTSPVYNLFDRDSINASHETSPTHDDSKFSWRLNTASMATGKQYGRLDVIPRHKRYNIILYFFESTPRKYYDMKINGRYVVETWHRLEKNSLNFMNHYANYPLSANALMSVLTSAYDLNSKDMVIQKYPDIPLRTLSEILKDRGYRTCLIHTGGLGYAGQKRFLKNRKIDSIIEYDDLITVPPYNQQVGWGVDERAMIKPAIEFITKKPGSPYFMVFLPVNPHHPYAYPDSSFKIAGVPGDNTSGKRKTWVSYLNSLHYADASLGMLIDELERTHCLDNTLIFLFADHGEAFYQHKMNYNHPLFLYNENVHVPFLIYNRELFDEPEYYNGITRHIDIVPAILDILGIPQRPEQEGVSPLSDHAEQLALLHTSWKDDYMGIVDQQWKYICRTGDRVEELYNLGTDPDEKENIAAENPEVANRYRRFIDKARVYKDRYFQRLLKK
jgi:arylsulfatase A-like enzyme